MKNIEEVKDEFPEISYLDLHFFNMKYHGLNEKELKKGETRPIFYLHDDKSFFLISFMISEDSPYTAEGNEILYNGEELPFLSEKAIRSSQKLPYFYLRGPKSPMHPTIDDENIINTGFNPKCSGGCDFCLYSYRNKHLTNITAETGLNMVMKERNLDSLKDFDEIAVVTGRFPSEEKLKDHLIDTIKYAKNNNFNGRLLYIGSQLTSPEHINEVVNELGDPSLLKYFFTVEKFYEREKIIHGSKGKKKIPEIIDNLKKIKDQGIDFLQYTYLVGIENIDNFMRGSEELADYAEPHISIFRKTGLEANEKTLSEDYINLGINYTIKMKKQLENLYGYEMIGNNYANLWPIPLKRFDLSQYREKIKDPLEVQNV